MLILFLWSRNRVRKPSLQLASSCFLSGYRLQPMDGATHFPGDLSLSGKPLCKYPHRHTQRSAIQVILNLVKLTMEMNHL